VPPTPCGGRSGAALDREDRALTRFTVVDLFADRAVRRSLIGAFLMMLSVTFAFWGVGTFIPTYVGSAPRAGFRRRIGRLGPD